jgi:hypothetical protein
LGCGRFGLHRFFLLLFFVFGLPLHIRRDLVAYWFGLNLFIIIFPARGNIFEGSGGSSLDGRFRHAHDRIGHAVGFFLVAVAGFVDGQLGLDQHGLTCQTFLMAFGARTRWARYTTAGTASQC